MEARKPNLIGEKSAVVLILSIIASSILVVASLWQIEVIMWCVFHNEPYDLPLRITTNNAHDYYYWHDVWFIINIAAWIMVVVPLVILVVKALFRRRRE